MMWLDSHAEDYRLKVQATLDRLSSLGVDYDRDDAELRAATQDDGSALQYTAKRGVEAFNALQTGQLRVPDAMLSKIVWHAVLGRFVLGIPCDPTAAVLSPDLVSVLSDTRISNEIRTRGRLEARSRTLTYLDLPDRALRVANELQVRALFIGSAPGKADEFSIHYTAILTPPGRSNWRRVAWSEDRAVILTDDYEQLELATAATHDWNLGNRLVEPLEDLVGRAGLVLREVLEDLETFSLLALSYIGTHEEDEAAEPWPLVPHLPLEHPWRRGRNARQVAKKFSFLKAQRVGMVAGRLGRLNS
ncbi:hypothetical protein [Microvirga massiliensis]|uniref:hypothetical protein n=1 Tax=Microvirga massiliensis TaxID=1033741 RepID=UPI00062B51D3|nr:hypothetical protein [Microvirga massiliensis]